MTAVYTARSLILEPVTTTSITNGGTTTTYDIASNAATNRELPPSTVRTVHSTEVHICFKVRFSLP